MERFTEKSRLIKVILESLKREPQRREKLLKNVLARCGSTAKFNSVFSWLVKQGYIAKVSEKHTAPFTLTVKGRKRLTAIYEEEGLTWAS
jgi:predicted transcriptional regulator